MTKRKVLITVKTYPALSTKYEELVCTAGFTEEGNWIRIYPVQFRKKPYAEQYKKYDWIEMDLVRNVHDFRPESYSPYSHDTEIKIIGHIGTDNNWKYRKPYVLKKIYTNITQLISEAKDKSVCTSLAVFKPSRIIDFIVKETEREWNRKKLEQLNQYNLFETTNERSKVVRKLPYKFSYKFQDDEGRECTLMIEDWEIGQLFWKMMKKYNNDEESACLDVKKKYLDDFAMTKNLHLFLGTTKSHHLKAPNPFVIIGTYTPRIERQLELF